MPTGTNPGNAIAVSAELAVVSQGMEEGCSLTSGKSNNYNVPQPKLSNWNGMIAKYSELFANGSFHNCEFKMS